METTSYAHRFDYGYDDNGMRRPVLKFQVSNPADPDVRIEIEGHLDCGAERSLLDGRIGAALGLDVLQGPSVTFETMAGSFLSATLHAVELSHFEMGVFQLEVAFSATEIRRNLLGRDFFDLVQIGFREHHLQFFVTPSP